MLCRPPLATLFPYATLFRSTLILDEEGLYDPSTFNDRLLLGLKGTMSEAALFVLRARLQGGILNKARRGALKLALDRKSTRLNSSHRCSSYAVFCLTKKANAASAHAHRQADLRHAYRHRRNSDERGQDAGPAGAPGGGEGSADRSAVAARQRRAWRP